MLEIIFIALDTFGNKTLGLGLKQSFCVTVSSREAIAQMCINSLVGFVQFAPEWEAQKTTQLKVSQNFE